MTKAGPDLLVNIFATRTDPPCLRHNPGSISANAQVFPTWPQKGRAALLRPTESSGAYDIPPLEAMSIEANGAANIFVVFGRAASQPERQGVNPAWSC